MWDYEDVSCLQLFYRNIYDICRSPGGGRGGGAGVIVPCMGLSARHNNLGLDTGTHCLDTGVAHCLYSGVAHYLDTGVAHCLDTGVAHCLDTGVAHCLDTGVAHCQDTGVANCLDTGVAHCLEISLKP